ncbi:MAG TPA: diacylglycerol kinase family protein [Acidimicrobiales bacterium]|nr:diacylglycerol kinase family protein [Acidimicrobiales bacterium]
MGPGRFLRRGVLRAVLGAGAASPFGLPAMAGAAVAGGAQEHLGLATGLAAGSALALARRRRDRSLAWRLALGAAVGLATRFVWPVAPRSPARVSSRRTWTDLTPSDDGAGVAIVVNPGAGSGALGPAPPPTVVLREGLPAATIVELDDAADLVGELVRLARSGCRAIGVAGGDGSINTAAGVALAHRLPLVVVPAGTLNHLARDLGVESVDDAVAAVRAGTAAEIDVGFVAGEPFLNTASFGSYVALVDAREELEGRIGKWPALAVALARVLRRGEPVAVDLDGERRHLWLVFVGNCRYLPEGMAPTWRERLDDGQLDVRVVDASHPFCRTRLVVAAMTGTLRRSRVFETWQTTSLDVRSHDGPLRLARDGETFEGADQFEICKRGDRLAVFTPRRAP